MYSFQVIFDLIYFRSSVTLWVRKFGILSKAVVNSCAGSTVISDNDEDLSQYDFGLLNETKPNFDL